LGPGFPDVEQRLELDPKIPTTVYVLEESAVYAGGYGQYYKPTFFKSVDGGASSDGGATWKDLSEGLPSFSVNSIAIDPAARVVYVGTSGGGICRRSF